MKNLIEKLDNFSSDLVCTKMHVKNVFKNYDTNTWEWAFEDIKFKIEFTAFMQTIYTNFKSDSFYCIGQLDGYWWKKNNFSNKNLAYACLIALKFYILEKYEIIQL